jgi:hypothetical protein
VPEAGPKPGPLLAPQTWLTHSPEPHPLPELLDVAQARKLAAALLDAADARDALAGIVEGRV